MKAQDGFAQKGSGIIFLYFLAHKNMDEFVR